jgi:hypothetical protein
VTYYLSLKFTIMFLIILIKNNNKSDLFLVLTFSGAYTLCDVNLLTIKYVMKIENVLNEQSIFESSIKYIR